MRELIWETLYSFVHKKCTYVTFNKDIYKQADGVAMDTPLDPVLASIIMVELEKTIVQGLSNHLYFWRRYVDNTFKFVKEELITFAMKQLNYYHLNSKFTDELEDACKLCLFDIFLIRQNNVKFETTLYRKITYTGIYLNWFSHVPNSW